MSIQRDYGTIGGVGYTGASNDDLYFSQVYNVTHTSDINLDGSKPRLPFMNRSFISFAFGEKTDASGNKKRVYIEDFNLVATISNNRWDRTGYSTFEDRTSTYDNLDGQYYWNTHYKTNTITFKLATDGIDQLMLENFLNWFRAGVHRELILSEHPNRAQMARVAEPPQLSLLPFEGKSKMIVSDKEYTITTTLYKGEITLKLILAEPHWYALDNLLGKQVTEYSSITNTYKTRYVDYWTNANNEDVSIFDSQDAMKILYEDNIPLGSMIYNNMLLGNSSFANVEDDAWKFIWSQPEADIEIEDGVIISGKGARINGTFVSSEYVAQTTDEIRDFGMLQSGDYLGQIAGATIYINDQGITDLSSGEEGHFYYAGTAPSPTIISFSLIISTSGNNAFNNIGYFNMINNNYTSASLPYNTLTIEASKKQELRFTTPNLFSSYNKAVDILKNYSGQMSVLDLRTKISEEVRHPAPRAWANALLENINNPASIQNFDNNDIKRAMTCMFKKNANEFFPMRFTFNSKTGEAIGEFSYRYPVGSISITSTEAAILSSTEITNVTEDIGDMLLSDNIILTERNHPNSMGKIVKWDNTPEGKTYSYRVYHNLSVPLSTLQIVYKNMYL